MIKTIVLALTFIHALIHLIGFSKAYHTNKGQWYQLMKSSALLWLSCSLLFFTAAWLFLEGFKIWTLTLLIAVVLSQTLVFLNWKEAKFGTILNFGLIILVWSLH